MRTWLAVWFCSSTVAHLREDAAQSAVDIVLWMSDIEELSKGNLLEDIDWGYKGMMCEPDEGDDLMSRTAERELQKLDSAKRTGKHFGSLEGPSEGDAKLP